ncbi:MauE/DoxX family redox-associated membrane protein [uncultured Lutibacter sp.]|uniref:MauE/DoxX family redox-associated membrane protein n=1 Tax=uncultured Lutibacter sp. TaxID=437739 RepID=UPI002601E389|nr:MauE/DoxX family redox-associated membrane protein [uncultured Lutibacter sp.]
METKNLKSIERIARVFLILLLIVGASYKLMDLENFVTYYEGLFTKSYVFKLPRGLILVLLYVMPFFELLIGFLLIFSKTRFFGLYGYLIYIMTMMLGEYFMDNFHNVNGTLDYMFIGFLCILLPTHKSLFKNHKN